MIHSLALGFLLAAPVAEIPFTLTDHESTVPDRFRLEPHSFPVEFGRTLDLPRSGIEIHAIRFPSPVTTSDTPNNTVHAELFVPKKPGRFPAVIVLDIMDGSQIVSRGEALWLAQHDIAALTIVMPYYGPRRPPGSPKMLSPDLSRSIANVRQAVLDCRRATAFLANHPKVDPDRLGVVGTSLGSLVGAVVAAAEPRLTTACLLLGGGGLVDAYWNHPKATTITSFLTLIGIDRVTISDIIAPVDPLTYAKQLKSKRLLLVAASRDDVVPPEATRRLWEATGKQRIVWFDATHVGAAAYAFPAMEAVIEHIHGSSKTLKSP